MEKKEIIIRLNEVYNAMRTVIAFAEYEIQRTDMTQAQIALLESRIQGTKADLWLMEKRLGEVLDKKAPPMKISMQEIFEKD